MKNILTAALVAAAISAITTMGVLKYPLDPQDRNIIRTVIQEELPGMMMNVAWENYFYYFTFYESLKSATVADGRWGSAVTGSAAVTVNAGMELATGATISSVARVEMEVSGMPSATTIFRWDKRQRFRANMQIDNLANVTAYFICGQLSNDIYYGFKMVGTSLKGVTKNEGSEVTINLLTAEGDTNYKLEARLMPKRGSRPSQIFFYVDDTLRGTITQDADIPSGTYTTGTAFFNIQITNGTAFPRTLYSDFLEYMQER